MAKKTNNYVDNEKLLEVLSEWKEQYTKAKEEERETPRLPEYVGSVIMAISENLANLYKFRNYTFIEEMKSDGIETCIKYIHNFDPEKSNKPFSYLTQIIYFSFLNRIKKEKKELYIKQKTLQNTYFEGLLSQQPLDESGYNINVDLDNPYMSELAEDMDRKKAEKSKKKPKNLEKFYEEGSAEQSTPSSSSDN